ncbi:MAG: hypothetical protein AAF465_05030 [Pseudomonadota bacterium]
MNRPLTYRVRRVSSRSTSYYDFVEKKARADTTALDLESTCADAFEVEVLDEETSDRLKLEYFGTPPIAR